MIMTTPENKPEPQRKALAPWKEALTRAEGKFLAISGKEEQTKIELGFAAQLIEGNPQLQKCAPESIMNAVINVARTGITLNPVMKLAHLVPRGGKCVLDFDYKGLVKILKDNGCCKDIRAVIVYEDEEFQEAGNPIEKPVHVKKYAQSEDEQKTRKIKGVYSQVLLSDNTVIWTEFMPHWRVLKVEKSSQGAGSSYSPWKTWREEMVMKTKLRYDFKLLISGSPSKELAAAIELEDSNNGLRDDVKNAGKRKSMSDIFATDVDYEPTEPEPGSEGSEG